MASTISISGRNNSGLQIGQNHGNITAHFGLSAEQFEISANQACLRDLQITNPRHDKHRIETVKGGLLKDAYSWILDHKDFKGWRYEQQSQLLWIKGDPGKGKTMLLCGIIDELTKSATDAATVSFFFCQATDVRINNAVAVLRGLIFMLVEQQSFLISHIRRHYDKTGKQIFEDVNAWEALSDILASILEDPQLQATYLIIDALDECTTGLDRLLRLVVQKSSAYPHVKWIVSSRNWLGIEETLGAASQQAQLCLELNETSVAEAVAVFIYHKVLELAEKKRYNTEIRDAVSQHLLSHANGTFLWVALVCKELTDVPKRHVRKKLQDFPSGLDELYKRMLAQISDTDDAGLCRSLLSVITTVYRPITLDELASYIDLGEDVADDDQALAEIVSLCGSFLTLRGRTISLVHQSAKDFLHEVHEIFPDGKERIHYSIFSKSLQAIARTLRRDIYGLLAPGYPIDQVKQRDPDPLAATRYSCVYWVDHLNECSPSINAKEDLQDSGLVGSFFCNDYLHWLEALSLSRSLSDGVASILGLERLLEITAENSKLLDRVRDACRFILYHKTAIENHPLQVYASGLIFSPAGSITRIQFEKQEPKWIIRRPTMEEGWSACLQTLEGHGSSVESVTFSHDSKLLASASNDMTVKIWDTSSGQCLQTFEGHSNSVKSVTLSYDSKLLASGSEDATVKIWDTRSGQCLQIFEGHGSSVESVTFSHDSKLLASASNDITIKIWDTSSGQCLKTLEDYSSSGDSVVFSHDSKLLASASYDSPVKIWDTSSGQCLQTLEGHSNTVNSVTFSHNSKLLASASSDTTVKIWDTSSGQCLQTLEGHSYSVNSVTFSHDSKLLASASDEGTVKIWDASSRQYLQTLEGHRYWVNSVSFSHDTKHLASASYDTTVKIWVPSSSRCLKTFKGHSDSVNSVTFSHDSKLLASGSDDATIKVWDTRSGQCLQTFKNHSNTVNSVTFSHDSALVASGSGDATVNVWDASSGKFLQTLKGHSYSVNSVTFSYDSKLLASSSEDATVKIWDLSSGQCLKILRGHTGSVKSVTFSHDSALLASASNDATIKIWDASSGQCLQTLEGHSYWVNSATFSHDSKLLASASNDMAVKIWDVSSGQCLQTLKVHSSYLNSVSFSHDSKLLAAASDDATVKVWDTSNRQYLQTLEGHGELITSVTFSYDSKLLASSSDDGTVKIWDASSGQCLQTLKAHTWMVVSVTFSYDSRLLASGSDDGTVKIWDASSGRCLQTLEGHSDWVQSVTFSQNSKLLASASHDATVKVWDTSSGQCLQTFKGHSNTVNSVTFSYDSKLLASASNDATIKIWDASSGRCLQTLEDNSNGVQSVTFSHDSALLVSASKDATIKIWDASSGQCLQTLDGRVHWLPSVKSFDVSNSCLETNIGTICLPLVLEREPTNTDPEVLRIKGYSINADGTCITWNSENLLWLPQEYRPRRFAVSLSTICLACFSGRMLFFTFDSPRLVHVLAGRPRDGSVPVLTSRTGSGPRGPWSF